MSNRAWVTLATNDSYGLGALVLAHSLKRAGSAYPSVVLITPSVTDAMRERLSAVFAEVITVDVLDSRDAAHLALLQRPELGITFTKIHCWNLTQYEKCVFLDADTLVVQNCDELFEREELSAAPDVGWPDCFNSGVFVFKPSAETFSRLITFAKERGSFDGGDQGLLNAFFSDWARGDISKHLPFLYNVTSAAFYSYIPALKHYGQNLKIIHFIGAAKPWLQQYNWDSNSVDAPEHIRGLLQLWWDIFVGQVHTQLDTTMVEVEGERQEVPPELPPRDVLYHYAPKLDPESEFPWHHPEAQISKDIEPENKLDPSQFYDPWERYRGIRPEDTQLVWSQKESKQNVWEYPQAVQHYSQSEQYHHYEHSYHDERQSQNQEPSHWEHFHQNVSDLTHSHEQHIHNHIEQSEHHSNEHYHGSQEVQTQYNYSDNEHCETHLHSTNHHLHGHHNLESHNYDQSFHSSQPNHSEPDPQPIFDLFTKDQDHHIESYNAPPSSDESYATFLAHLKQKTPQYVYCVHLDHSKPRKQRQKKLERVEVTITQEMMNGHDLSEVESEDFDDIIPRHPYDGFYLRHRVTIDACGRKVCTHEIPPAPSPPASPSPCASPELLNEESEANDEASSKVTQDQTGVAGNLARVQVSASSERREAIDELARRQGWEAGNIDYMGADSFDNIWAKISQTLSQPSPKQPSPPKETSKESAAPAVDAAPPAPAPSAAPSQETKTETTPVDAAKDKAAEDIKGEVPPVMEISSVPTSTESQSTVAEKAEASAPKPVAEPPVKAAEPAASVTATPKPTEALVKTTAPAPPVVASPETPVKVAEPVKVEEKVKTTEAPPVPIEPLKESPIKPPAPVADLEAASKADVPLEAKKSEPVEKAVEAIAAPVAAKVETKVESAPAQESNVGPKVIKTEIPAVPPTPPVTPKSTPEASTPVSEVAPVLESQGVKAAESTPAKEEVKATPAVEEAGTTLGSDSPPLANTPSKEKAPPVPVAKSEEKRRPGSKLVVEAAASVGTALPTPDSEAEDAAALAHAIIAGELRTVVTCATPPAPPTPAAPLAPADLAPQPPQLPTPPIGVSLAQIGVKPKTKPTTADAIESSLSEATSDAPKKKVVKKAVKKEGEVPVPPPRKKEKKPKDK